MPETASLESTRRTRQRLLGVMVICGTAVLMVGDALTPSGADDHVTTAAVGLKALAAADRHPTQLYVSSVLLIVGLACLGWTFPAVASLIRARGALPATWAAALGAFGGMSAAVVNALIGLDTYAAHHARISRGAGAEFLVSAQHTSAVAAVFSIGYFGGLILGGVLLGVAVWRSRLAPRWVGPTFAIGLLIAAAAPGGPVGAALSLPWAAAMIALAAKLLRPTPTKVAEPRRRTQPASA